MILKVVNHYKLGNRHRNVEKLLKILLSTISAIIKNITGMVENVPERGRISILPPHIVEFIGFIVTGKKKITQKSQFLNSIVYLNLGALIF